MDIRGAMHLAGEWDNFAAHSESDYTIHSNIRSSSAGFAVRNELTGEVIGHVAGKDENMDTLTIGGRQHRVTQNDQTIVVTPVSDDGMLDREDTPRYRGRRRPVSETFAAHIRAGCGLRDDDAPIVATPDGLVWFHFGGEVFESAIFSLLPKLQGISLIAGVALRIGRSFTSDELCKIEGSCVTQFTMIQGFRLLEDEGLGRFADELPPAGVKALTESLGISVRLTNWLLTRRVTAANSLEKWPSLQRLYSYC